MAVNVFNDNKNKYDPSGKKSLKAIKTSIIISRYANAEKGLIKLGDNFRSLGNLTEEKVVLLLLQDKIRNTL